MIAFRVAMNRLETAAMAYERLGKLARDDEKTRQIRKDTMAELTAARRNLLWLHVLAHSGDVEGEPK